jgi:glutamate 5-kinase
MTDRTAILGPLNTIVVKLGTQVLSDEQNRLDPAFLDTIARQVATLRGRGCRVTVVSSGAAGSGMAELGLSKRPSDLAQLQAVAAVGQRKLMDAWASAFAPLGLRVAQILLTREDIDHRSRFLNLRNTINACHDMGAIPIINENDTVSTDELVRITFGDNDILAAVVTQALQADLLVLLSVVDGVLDAKKHRVPMFDSIDDAKKMLMPTKSALGKGGMNSKLEAARIVTGSGQAMVVAHGRDRDVLIGIAGGADVGTLFIPRSSKRGTRSRWMRSARGKGRIVVDDGAARALRDKGKSLLPAGVLRVEDEFDAGTLIDIVGADGTPIARGLSNYSSEDVRRIAKKKTADVRAELGANAYDEVVHRNNLVVV